MAPRGVCGKRTGGRVLPGEDDGQEEMHLEARGGGKQMRAKKWQDTSVIELLISINETVPAGLCNKEEMLSGRSWESAPTRVSEV